jgi:hypothetical protein
MVYDPGDGGGAYLFLFDSLGQGPSSADCWFESLAEAEEHARRKFGIEAMDWQSIPDPEPGRRHDLMEPLRGNLPEQVGPEDVPAWHLGELAERRAEAGARPGVGKPWREVLGPLEGGS